VKSFSLTARLIAGTIIFIVAPAWLAFGQDAYAPNEFEQRNQLGVKKNPSDLKFEIRTQDGGDTYHLYETIPVEMVFSSSRPATYSIEMNEAMNRGAQRYRFEVDQVDAVVVYDTHYRTGIVCCQYDSLNLSSKPIILRKELTDFLRFEKAGTYNIFATTERVFRTHGIPKASQPPAPGQEMSTPTLTLTSNLLTLTIQPDDPVWDNNRLTGALRALHDQQALKDYKKAAGGATTPRFRALQELSVLDTVEAIRERVAISSLAEDNSIVLASTTRPDLMLAALEDRAMNPSVALGATFEDAWTKFKVQRDCPEVFRRSQRDIDTVNRNDNYSACRTEAYRKLIPFLQSTLPLKTGAARESTARAIERVKRDYALTSKNR
jgi:hypothetical protein